MIIRIVKTVSLFLLLVLAFAGLGYCILYFMGLMPGLTTGQLYTPGN